MALPPKPISRRVHDLSEIVVVRWQGEWIKGVQYLSSRRHNSEDDELLYKQAIAYWARYPEEESWRITSIKPVAAGVELLELEITFLNPGKAYEAWICTQEGSFAVPDVVTSLLRDKLCLMH